jgi:hypothetical protein
MLQSLLATANSRSLFLTFCSVLFAAGLFAQPNDDCANAIAVTLDVAETGSTVGATP